MIDLKRGSLTKYLTFFLLLTLILGGSGLNVPASLVDTSNSEHIIIETEIASPQLEFVKSGSGSGSPQPLAPPPAPVRQPAEFDPMEGVLIRYPFGISYSLIAEMSEDVDVVTVVNDNTEKTTVETDYIANGVNMANCKWLFAPSNTKWTRDYGPWFVFNGLGQQGIVNHTYNRPTRTKDNVIPEKYGINQSIPVYDMPLIHSGGNYMCDGLGIAVSTDLVIDENPGLTQTQIEQTAQSYLGIHTYHLVPDALGEYIKHIDCWAKFLAPDKILIGQVPPTDPQFNDFETAVQYFENQTSSYGWPYKIYRVYAPNGEPYTNSLILNDKVLVPVTGSTWDNAAITSYQTALPSHEVLGFTGSWAKTDALHCRTMGITDRDMLYIEHTPLEDAEPVQNGFYVDAKVLPYSGGTLNGMPKLYWRHQGTITWQQVTMTSLGNDIYDSYISSSPQPVDGSIIEYYLQAQDTFGQTGKYPFVEPFHTFTVNVIPPVITDVQAVPPAQIQDGSVEISANVTDNIEVGQVYLQITYLDETGVNFSITQNVTGDYYSCNQIYSDVGIYNYTIWVIDINNKWSESDTFQFEILDVEPPVANAGPDQLVMRGTEVILNGTGSWDNNEIINWTWEVPFDASTQYAYGQTSKLFFNEIGEFEVVLTVIDGAGLFNTDKIWINVSSPDYVVLNPNYTESTTVSINTQIQILNQVKNVGGIDANAETVLSYYNSTEPGEPFYEYVLDPLIIDMESEEINAYWISPSTPGTYFVTIMVDYYNEIEELDEDNNNHTLEFIVVDKPVTTPHIGAPGYVLDKIYITSNTNISFSVVDNSGTGVGSTKYKIGYGTDWTDISPSENFNIPDEGAHTVFYYSTDGIGGVEDFQQFELVVDNTAPQTTIGLGVPSYRASANNNWNISVNTPINFTTIDIGLLPVGELYIEYRIDSVPGWNYFTTEFTLNGLSEGPHLIEYRAADKIKNMESTNSVILNIDSTVPATTVNIGDPTYESDKVYITSNTEIRFEVDDPGSYGPGSGVQVCYYNIDESATFSIYNFNGAISGLTEGEYSIAYYSIDWIGNIEPEKEITVIVDNSPPETTVVPGDEFTLTIIDNPKGNGSNSGVKTTLYRIDDGDWLDYAQTGKFTVPKGKHEISFYSIDNLNNTEQIKTLEVEIKDDEDENELGIIIGIFALLAILIIVFLLILMLIKRKRQKSEPLQPPPLPPEPEVTDQMPPPEQVPSLESEQLEEIPPPDLESQPPIATALPQEPEVALPSESVTEPGSDLLQNEDNF